MISSVAASPNLFTLLGVEPIIGRGFIPNETISDHPNVVLLSYDIWQRSFAADRNALGQTGEKTRLPSEGSAKAVLNDLLVRLRLRSIRQAHM
jgi:hypothetical protein